MPTTLTSLFAPDEIERGRRYNRPRYRALVAQLALGWATLAALAWWRPGLGLPWPAEAPLLVAVTLGASSLVRLPVAWWSDHVHERRWGLTAQSGRGWLADRLKGLAVGVVLGGIAFLALVGLARGLGAWWPAVAAPGAALLVVLLAFVAPVVLEPVFNRFDSLEDGELRRALLALAQRAGAPVRDVLVADASRRTTKANAYVSGIGRTRRVVLFDTFVRDAEPGEALVVTAHELAHRRERHVVRLTALGALGAAGGVLVLSALPGRPEPESVPLFLLVLGGLQLLLAPATAWLSRRYEREADRISLELTRDLEGYEALFRRLARQNVADLDPPRLVQLFLGSHPTIPERIAAGRAFDTVPG